MDEKTQIENEISSLQNKEKILREQIQKVEDEVAK